MDPEDVRTLLGRLFEIAREEIEEHCGRVEKVIGDAIMRSERVPPTTSPSTSSGCASGPTS